MFSIKSFGVSDKGRVRSNNEDAFAELHRDNFQLFVVSDGMGGTRGGEVASSVAVQKIVEFFDVLDSDFNALQVLKDSMLEANFEIVSLALTDDSLRFMGATASVLLIKNDTAYVGNIGDSRVYLIRGDEIKQLTKDHSYVQYLLDLGQISEIEVRNHPQRNIITKSLGIDGSSQPDVFEGFQVLSGDFFLLCSDGLTEHLTDTEICDLSKDGSLDVVAKKLVKNCIKKGGSDNITLILVKVL